MAQHLHEPHPNQDPRAQGVQSSHNNQRLLIILIKLIQHAEANAHAKWGGRSKRSSHNALRKQRAVRQGRDTGAEGEAFEHLVEDDNDEEGAEGGVAGYNEGDTNHCTG